MIATPGSQSLRDNIHDTGGTPVGGPGGETPWSF
jgi:hypothetical protein